MAKERGEADAWGRETLDRYKGRPGFGQSLNEVGSRGERGGEPVSQPPYLTFWGEYQPIQVDRRIGDVASVPGRAPVDELRLGDREADAQPCPSGLQLAVLLLQDLDVAPIGRRGGSHTEVVNVGEGETTRDLAVQAGYVNNK